MPADRDVENKPVDRSVDPDAESLSPTEALALLRGMLGRVWPHRSSWPESWQKYDDLITGRKTHGTKGEDTPFDVPSYQELAAFDSELAELKLEFAEMAETLVRERANREEKEVQLRELQEKLDDLLQRVSLSHLLTHLSDPGRKSLLSSDVLRKHFMSGEACDAYVVSIDIRRSTELMLKSRTPQQFASFVTQLADDFRRIILDQYGVFDKFTGDGILAYFTRVYSGADAGYRAVKAASQCHDAFAKTYETNRGTFVSVLKNVGLGIGIDYGTVHVLQVAGDITVVGTPVVYACRMAGASAGLIFANQGAYDQLKGEQNLFTFTETELDIKHEGPTLAYAVRLAGTEYAPEAPEWTASLLQ